MYKDFLSSDDPELEDLKQKVGTYEYLPSCSVDIESQDLHNPGIEIYKKQHSWTENGWDNVGNTDVLLKCPEYLPTDKSINYLTELSRIVEIGAGNGYWSYVINQNGGICDPTDISPKDVPHDQLPENYYETQERQKESIDVERPFPDECEDFPCSIPSVEDNKKIVWSEVRLANHNNVKDSRAENVLLCHPVKYEWTEDLLDLIIEEQKDLILVAQWEPGPDATPRFFHRLHENWNLKNDFPVIDWSSMHAHGYVFQPPKSR